MRLLALSHVRESAHHWGSVVAAVAGMALGIASLVATHLVNARVAELLSDGAVFERTSRVIVAADPRMPLAEARYFELRRAWRAGDLPGVTALVPVVEGFVLLETEAAGVSEVALVGFDPVAAPAGLGLNLDREARDGALTALLLRDAVLASAATGLAVGDTAMANGVRVEVAGSFAGRPERALLVADVATAQRLMGREALLTGIRAQVNDVTTRVQRAMEALAPGLSAVLTLRQPLALPNDLRELSMQTRDPTGRFADAMRFNLGALGALGLFVALFLIYQSSHASIARRAPTFGRLVHIGVAPRQLMYLVLIEASILGLLAGALGLAIGFITGELVLAQAMGSSVLLADAPVVVGKALVAGVAQATIAALVAWRALAIDRAAERMTVTAPSDALAPVRAQPAFGGAVAGLLGSVCVVLGLLSGSVAGGFLAVLGLSLVQVFIVVPGVLVWLVAMLRRLKGGYLTRANLRATAAMGRDAGLAVAVLSVAVAAAIGIGVMVTSLRADFEEMLSARLGSALFLDEVPEALRAELVARDDIEVRAYGDRVARVDGAPIRTAYGPLDDIEVARYGVARRPRVPNLALPSEGAVEAFGLAAGDVIELSGDGGTATFHLGPAFRDYGQPEPRVVIDVSQARGVFSQAPTPRLTVAGSDRKLATLRAELAASHPHVRVRDDREIRAMASSVFDRTFVVTRYITLIALVVGALGLYNALAFTLRQRSREFGMLRVLGVGARELGRLALQQTAALGAVAVLVAVPLGLAIAWLLCSVVNPRSFGWTVPLRIEAAALWQPLLLGWMAALAAGLWPLRRAARDAPMA